MNTQQSKFSEEERLRYARQWGPGVLDEAAQRRLKAATVLISRVGGMGGPAAEMLTMAGVGRLIIAHGGKLISPDLNRQVLGSEAGIGSPRAGQFGDFLRSRNRFVEVEARDYEPNDEQADALAQRSDLVLSCAPTFVERLRLNRAAAQADIPIIDAAQWGMSGSLIVSRPGSSACLACVYPTEPAFEELFPVVGAISSAIGSLAALEAIKIISQVGNPAIGKMFLYDGFQATSQWIDLQLRKDCPVCRHPDEP